jgi:DNA invertase Pin-like site-specific DNA recombinase
METRTKPNGYAIPYRRYSSGEQEKGESLARQKRKFDAFCGPRGFKEYEGLDPVDDKGVSAFRSANLKKGSLGQFLLRAKAGEIPKGTVLVVENQDRLSRDKAFEVLGLFQQLIRAGILIGDCLSNTIYDEGCLSDPLPLLMIIMGAVRAHDYSRSLSERSNDNWEQKRQRLATEKMTKMAPHWLEAHGHTEKGRNGKDRFQVDKYVPVPDRVKVIKLIFQLACQGKGCRRIVDELETKGIRTFKGNDCWHPNMIIKVIKNRSVIGEFQPSKRLSKTKSVPIGDAVPDYYPAIISQKDFGKANALVTSRNRRSGRPPNPDRVNLFAGLLFADADHDKNPYHIHYAKDPEYRALRPRYGNGGPSISYNMMEHAFFMCIKEIDPAGIADKPNDEIEELTAELASIDAKLATAKTRVKAEKGDVSYLLDIIRDLTSDQKTARKALEDAQMRQRNPVQESFKALQGSSLADPEYVRARMRLTIDRITMTVRDVKLAGKHFKLADVQVCFRGGYSKSYSFGYRNFRGYLSEPLHTSDCLRFAGHEPRELKDIVPDQHTPLFFSMAMETAIQFTLASMPKYTEEQIQEWERSAE